MDDYFNDFPKNFLDSVGDTKLPDCQLRVFRNALKIADFQHMCRGDVLLPLKSSIVKDMSGLNNPLGHFLANPSEEKLKVIEETLSSCKMPIARIWIHQNILRLSLRRQSIIRMTIECVTEKKKMFGSPLILKDKVIAIKHITREKMKNSVSSFRGDQLVHHISKVLMRCGASVRVFHRSIEDCLPTEDKAEESSLAFIMHDNCTINFGNDVKLCHYMPVVDIKSGKMWRGSADDYSKILMEELRLATEAKHGNICSPEWTEFLQKQANQCMILQMLYTAPSHSIKVALDGRTQNSREWAFILYNYARMNMIFESFEEWVSNGAVLPLPPTEEVDFSLLTKDEEWTLVWAFILRWPEVVREVALSIQNEEKPKSSLVTRFLHSLAHRLSEYYSRHQVLVPELLPHLLPLMYARLYLLKALQTVMAGGFETLGVTPPTSYM